MTSRLSGILKNRALAHAKSIDRATNTRGSKFKGANSITDPSALSTKVNTAKQVFVTVKRFYCPVCEAQIEPLRPSTRVATRGGWECFSCGLAITTPIVGYEQIRVSESPLENDADPTHISLANLRQDKPLVGKANGPVATPSSYKTWIKAGKPAHPIYNFDAYMRKHIDSHGVMGPTGGPHIDKATRIHEPDCDCAICREFKGRIQHVPDPRINPCDMVGYRAQSTKLETQRTIAVICPPLKAHA